MVCVRFRYWVVCFISAFIMGSVLCGCGSPVLPLETLKKNLQDSPTGSIVLEDMKEEGNFLKKYYHKYKVIEPDYSWTTEWSEVPKKYYMKNESLLGMALFAKKDGEETASAAPPGYAYVGDSRYGQWRSDGHGGSFWEFYGKYALFSQLFGGWYRPIYRQDYDQYTRYRSSGRTFYGRKNEYGSSGTIAKRQKPNFYARRMAGVSSAKKAFSQKVSQRIGRTRTGFRGRAGGRGK